MRYENNGEWSGWSVHSARTGWVLEQWSRFQGDLSGRKILIPYGKGWERGADLHRTYTTKDGGEFTLAEYIFYSVSDQHITAKVIRRGEVVE